MHPDEYRSTKVHISMSKRLLQQVDELVLKKYSNRSVIIRHALIDYIQKPENERLLTRKHNKPYADPDEKLL